MIKASVEAWASSPHGWLTLLGGTGTGKTHLAGASANVRLAAGDEVRFAVVPDLLDELRRTYGEGRSRRFDEVFDDLRYTGLLVLDDLGAHSATEWAQEKLYQLCAHRYVQRSPTIITTNLALEDLDPRIASRLADQQVGTVYRIRARDHRTSRATDTLSPGRGRRGWQVRGRRQEPFGR